ncbi:hypothetical protein [Corynebacterium renale]|uniref:Uncharacterized protein n=1 Tax=Corynebacterium renale TaxID=1724 RepID=A0A2A9DMM5_9CORY|nr:hypothetical protein [Corynebacterium renale]PFG27616.1 hypothetical protein ATK06_0688 [Corynebacterium renale]SQI22802.1 Uncharacterised protein [Corynebacterium renale]
MRRVLTTAAALILGLGLTACSDNPPPAPYLAEAASSTAQTTTSTSTSSEAVTTTVTTVVAKPSKGECAPTREELLANDPSPAGAIFSSYCDGQYQVAAGYATDGSSLQHWNGEKWEYIKSTGKYPVSMKACFYESDLISQGVPADVRAKVMPQLFTCPTSTPEQPAPAPAPAPSPASNLTNVSCGGGRYVLIVESVLAYDGQDPKPLVDAGLARHPGALATSPGACPSLRGRYDGADVYPIYKDYGSDRAGVCAAQARGEGNARELKSSVDNYASPC